MNSSKILLWDLETTSLKSDFGFILAAGYKWLGDKKATVLSIGDFNAKNFRNKEKSLVKEFASVLSQAEVSVTHNGQRYDHPWMNAKMLHYRLGYLPPMPQVDTLQIARKHLRTVSRKRLDTLAEYFGTYEQKSPVEGSIWIDAAMGVPSALRYVIEHCRKDVVVLEEMYLLLRPLLIGHPRINGYAPCRYCGERRLQRRGPAITTLKTPKYRYQCMACGGWDTRIESST